MYQDLLWILYRSLLYLSGSASTRDFHFGADWGQIHVFQIFAPVFAAVRSGERSGAADSGSERAVPGIDPARSGKPDRPLRSPYERRFPV